MGEKKIMQTEISVPPIIFPMAHLLPHGLKG